MLTIACAVLCGVVSGVLVYGIGALGDEALKEHNVRI